VNSYAVGVKPPARKELESLPDNVLARARPTGCKKLKGHKDQWRIRIGDWRVVYVVDDAAQVVSVTRIAHRREVYE
jgi:mRNA-degrading endonuclease RelE of RelBE toxin-antitoxin system